MKQLKDLLKTEMNGESVRRHVYLLTEKMTADDDDDDVCSCVIQIDVGPNLFDSTAVSMINDSTLIRH